MLLLLIATCIVILGMSFVCSLTEAVLLSLNPLALKVREKPEGRGAPEARWLAMKRQIERPVAAILVFNTIANTGLVTFAGALFSQVIGDHLLWAFSANMCVAVLLAGEITPKILGVHHAERLAPHLIAPLTWMVRLCHPLVLGIEILTRKLRVSSSIKTQSDQIMDIITLVQSARAEQLLHNHEEIIMIHAATLSARRVKTAMVPRDAVRVFDLRLTLRENVIALGPKLHRSYPVSADGTLKQIAGYIRVRELFVQNLIEPAVADWKQLIRPVLQLDENSSLTQLLTLFLEKQEIAALVEHSRGQITGWVTLDDVMKVLMGERI